jgi:hypothetical protein
MPGEWATLPAGVMYGEYFPLGAAAKAEKSQQEPRIAATEAMVTKIQASNLLEVSIHLLK